MNIQGATSEQVTASALRQQKLEGQEAVALIQGAAVATQAQSGGSQPPPQPVQVAPRPGSSIEVVA